MTEEDEAFEELERRQRAQKALDAMVVNARELGLTDDYYAPDTTAQRNQILEEIADRVEREFNVPFGHDTASSFAVFIRRMKR